MKTKHPKPAQLAHAQKITHRDRTGKFKPAPPPRTTNKQLAPPELDMDAGNQFNLPHDQIQE